MTDGSVVDARYPAEPLTIPTPNEDNIAIHPDVLDMGAGGWNGYRYWMAMTPYTGSSPAVENPCILASNDRTTWVEPAGISNPIEPAPAEGANSDTDLYFDSATSTMYCVWRVYITNTSETLYYLKSTDGVTWTDKTEVLSGETWNTVISPAIIHDGTQFVMYCIDRSIASPFGINKRTAASLDGPWSAASSCTLTNQPQVRHIDVILDNGTYYALVSGSEQPNLLYLATSADGDLFTFQAYSVLFGDAPFWTEDPYRGTIIKSNDGFYLWYSAYDGDHANSQIGYAELKHG